MRRWKQRAWALVLGAVTAMALTAEARAADSILLFYNFSTSLAMTARADANGTVVGLRTFSFDPGWNFIVPTGNGLVLFYKLSGVVGTGRFQADGSYQDLQSGNGLFDGHNVVSTSDGILLFYSYYNPGTGYNGYAVTGRIDAANGNYVRLRSFTGFDRWSHIVPTSNGLVLFYDGATGKVVTARVGANGSYQDLKNYTGFDRNWGQIVSTSDGILLFNNPATAVAVTGRIDANGNYADLKTFIGWRDRKIFPTTNGLVLFYSPSGVVEAGRIGADGSFQELKYNPGFPGWTNFVSVR